MKQATERPEYTLTRGQHDGGIEHGQTHAYYNTEGTKIYKTKEGYALTPQGPWRSYHEINGEINLKHENAGLLSDFIAQTMWELVDKTYKPNE